jgi:hypothetical protein
MARTKKLTVGDDCANLSSFISRFGSLYDEEVVSDSSGRRGRGGRFPDLPEDPQKQVLLRGAE